MKRILLILFLFVLAQNWRYVLAWGVEYDPGLAGEVVLLSTSTCGYCAKTRRFLDLAGVPFRDLDVEKSFDGQRRYAASGAYGVPVLIVGERIIHGYDPGAYRDALNAAPQAGH